MKLIMKVLTDFARDLPLIHGAAIAYYAILALVPLMYLSFLIFGQILGEETMEMILRKLLSEQVGISDVDGLLEILNKIDFAGSTLVLKISGLLMVAFSCTAITNSLRKSINKFYGLQQPELHTKKKIVGNLLFRLISLLAIVAVTLFVIVIYFAETILLSVNHDFFEDIYVVDWIFSELALHGLPILTNILVLTFVFKFMHDGIVKWRIAIRGALTTGVLLYFGQLMLKLYLTRYFFASGVGVAGSILMLLVWVYYSSLIILLGIRFTAEYARFKGVPIKWRD